MSGDVSPSLILAAALHGDLSHCLKIMDYVGVPFAAAHLATAIESLRSEIGLPEEREGILRLAELELSYSDEVAELVKNWHGGKALL